MKCPKCYSDNPDDSNFCKECGTDITSAEEAQALFTKTLESPAYIVAQRTVFAERYEILEKIGEGGMGEVYLALDKNLDRQVAVKVLPAAFDEDVERLARFEREAKLLAVLNHPNIAAIYGLEESKGQRFLVLELVEGETLKTRLDKGPIELEEALDLCHQITEGLEAAHEKSEPDWTKLPSDTPTLIRALLRRCLEKDPRNRLRDIGDARIEGGDIPFPSPDGRWLAYCSDESGRHEVYVPSRNTK